MSAIADIAAMCAHERPPARPASERGGLRWLLGMGRWGRPPGAQGEGIFSPPARRHGHACQARPSAYLGTERSPPRPPSPTAAARGGHLAAALARAVVAPGRPAAPQLWAPRRPGGRTAAAHSPPQPSQGAGHSALSCTARRGVATLHQRRIIAVLGPDGQAGMAAIRPASNGVGSLRPRRWTLGAHISSASHRIPSLSSATKRGPKGVVMSGGKALAQARPPAALLPRYLDLFWSIPHSCWDFSFPDTCVGTSGIVDADVRTRFATASNQGLQSDRPALRPAFRPDHPSRQLRCVA